MQAKAPQTLFEKLDKNEDYEAIFDSFYDKMFADEELLVFFCKTKRKDLLA